MKMIKGIAFVDIWYVHSIRSRWLLDCTREIALTSRSKGILRLVCFRLFL